MTLMSTDAATDTLAAPAAPASTPPHMELHAEGLDFPTSAAFTDDGTLYVAASGLPFGGARPGGRVVRIRADGAPETVLEGSKPMTSLGSSPNANCSIRRRRHSPHRGQNNGRRPGATSADADAPQRRPVKKSNLTTPATGDAAASSRRHRRGDYP